MWRCPPGEAFAARYGLTYQVWSSDNINWAAQENALFLEDYYKHLDCLVVEDQTLAILHRLVEEHPGMFLPDLQALSEISTDLINISIARHDLYVDLATYRLSELWRTPVFRLKGHSRATAQVRDQSEEYEKQRRKEREALVCEEVRQAVPTLHAQNIFPSHRKVRDLLSDPNLMRMLETAATWHAVRHELGLEQ